MKTSFAELTIMLLPWRIGIATPIIMQPRKNSCSWSCRNNVLQNKWLLLGGNVSNWWNHAVLGILGR